MDAAARARAAAPKVLYVRPYYVVGPGALYLALRCIGVEGHQGAILAIRSPVVFLVNENIRPENVECTILFSSHTLLFCQELLAGWLSPFLPPFSRFLCDVMI